MFFVACSKLALPFTNRNAPANDLRSGKAAKRITNRVCVAAGAKLVGRSAGRRPTLR